MMSGAWPAAIDVQGLTRRFGDRVAVEELTLAVAPGEVVALLGPNGAGKTTTLRMLAGLLRPTAGGGTVAGVPLGGEPQAALRARIGLLTETPGLWDRLTVWTNLITYARLQAVADPGARVGQVLERLGLADRAGDVRPCCRRGSGSVSPSPAPSCTRRPCCCSTSQPRGSIPPPPAACARSWPSWRATAPPPSSARTI